MAENLRVYIAGPMSSVGGNFNFPLFDEIAEGLRARGCEVFSPAEYVRGVIGPLEHIQKLGKTELNLARKRMLKDELNWIMDNAQIVCMLPGWERSTGATAERAVALALGIKVIEAGTIVPGLAGFNLDLAEEAE